MRGPSRACGGRSSLGYSAGVRRVEHVIVGAGLAGLVLARMLGRRAVVLDPSPASYKIGESLIPELFRHPELARLLPRVRALPSYSPKAGSTFVAGDEVAFFPLAEEDVPRSMHVARPELERAMLEAWEIEVEPARVVAIDWERRRVETSAGPLEFTGLVLDCSGPAMIVASLRGEVEPLAPVFATWGYHDVVAREEGAWARRLQEEGRRLRCYDPRHRRLLMREEAGAWAPTRTTVLRRIDDGVWTWQIPLAHETLLSYGVVSRRGPVSEDMYRAITARETPGLTLAGPRTGGAGPFERLHRRDGFARAARAPAGRDFILLADACAFSDPVYSVGASFAVNSALEVAELLAGGPWTREVCEAYCGRARELLARARRAFEFWYSGELLTSPAAAAEVRDDFLQGELFHRRLSDHYGDALADAEYAGGRDPFAPRPGAASVEPAARALLELEASGVRGWRLVGADPCAAGVALRFRSEGLPDMTLLVAPAGAGPCFRVVGPLALSYMGSDAAYSDMTARRALLDEVAARLPRGASGWLSLLGGLGR